MKKTAKSSKTIRANKRKAKLRAKTPPPASTGDCLSHSESGAEGIVSKRPWLALARMGKPGWLGSTLAPSENPVTRR